MGGVCPQHKLNKYAPTSCIADLNQQNEKQKATGSNIVSGGSGDFSVQMNGNDNSNISNEQQQLLSKVAEHCGCPIDIARKALEAANWNPRDAVTRIEAMRQNNGQ